MATSVSSTSSSPALATPGIGSGLDVTGLVSKLMSVEQQPLTTLSNRQASFQSKLSAYGSIKSALSSLQTAAQALTSAANFSVTKASVADASILTATSSSSAVAGTYNVEVTTLAQAQKLVSGGVASTTTSLGTGSGTGTLTINLGSYTTASGTTSFTGTQSVAISLDSSNNTLSGIQSAINNANAGVTASIINDGTNNRLVVTSKDTGTDHAIQITTSGDAGFAQLAYDASTGGTSSMTQSVAAQDATFKVDNVAITKHSNTVTDAIQGVTLNLAKTTGTGVTTQVSVIQDTATITTNIQALATAYNKVKSLIAGSTAYNATTQSGSVLTGDSTVRGVQQSLAQLFSTPVAGLSSDQASLSSIGISFQKDGSLSVDSSKLQTALTDPTKDVKSLFISSTSTTGYAAQVNTLVGDMLSSTGTFASRTNGLNSSIKDLENQKTALNNRLVMIEKNYLKQFNALDGILSSMTSTSNYLTQQLKSLQASNN